MSIEIHPRYFEVRQAGLAVSEAVLAAIRKYNLSYHEVVSILLVEAQNWTKYGIRTERHPNDPDKKGDEA